MRVTLITTIVHNVGDDFVREGILHLLDSIGVLDGVEFIHKHSPITAVYGFEKYHRYRVSRVLEPVTRVLRLKDRVSRGRCSSTERRARLLVSPGWTSLRRQRVV